MSDETPNTAPSPEAASPAPADAPPPDGVDTSVAEAAAPAAPSPIQGLSYEQAIDLAQRLAAQNKPAPQAPAPPPPLPEVALLNRFETDAAARAEIVRQMMVGGDPANPAHVAIVNAALRAEAGRAQMADQFKSFEARFAEAQQAQQIQAQRQHADNVFTAQLSRFEPINPGLQTTLARATAGLMHQGYSVEQATAQVFADMAPMLRLKGQAGRPTNTQVGARQIVGNAQAQAAVAAQANGAGRLAPKPMAEMSREDRKAALAAARRSIFATPQN